VRRVVVERQVPALRRRYRIVTLDLPGHGKSGMPKAFSMELFARAIEAVRRRPSSTKPFSSDTAMGTPVIRKYALMYPERVSGLVIVDGLVHSRPMVFSPGNLVRTAAGDNAAGTRSHGQGNVRSGNDPSAPGTHPQDDDGRAEATAAGAMAATWDTSQLSDQKITVPVLAVLPARGRWPRSRR
jgi:pimeloyl-ACP methyl ester carboxylesterase